MKLDPSRNRLLDARQVASPNFDERPAECEISLIVIHGISLPPGEYGGPEIDRFFTNAVRFTDAISASGATYLSATATATGTEAMLNSHSYRKIRRDFGGGSWRVVSIVAKDGELLIDRIPTTAETLAENGYTTIGINDWINTGPRVFIDRGYQKYVETPLLGSTI